MRADGRSFTSVPMSPFVPVSSTVLMPSAGPPPDVVSGVQRDPPALSALLLTALWISLWPTHPHVLAHNRVLSGSFPVLGPRGYLELRLNQPSLWGSELEALGFRVTKLQLFGGASGSGEQTQGFKAYL